MERYLGHLVDVHHRDVCGKKALLELKNGGDGKLDEKQATNRLGEGVAQSNGETTDKTDESDGNNNDNNKEEDDGKGGFQLPQAVAHAIFLDLPEPWLAVPHAAFTIKPNGRVCSYSPCMEQTQRTVAAMRQHGFHSMRTVEARLKEYFVDEVEMEAPPTDLPVIVTEENLSMEKERCASGGLLKPDQKMQDTKKDTVLEETNGKKRKSSKLLCARPFGVMRGHTAFLTFATAGLAPRPDPNA